MAWTTPDRQRRDFQLLAAGQALSWLGNGFQTVALAVAVVLTGGGASQLGAVMACSVLAMLACTLFGGVWADRLQPQQTMAFADLVRFAAVSGMAISFSTQTHSLPLLCALAALSSAAGSFFTPAMTALKPMLAAGDRLGSANATLGLLQTTCSVLGPAAGGVVVGALGASAGFWINAATFLASAASVLSIRSRVTRAPRQRMLTEIRLGWAEIRRRDWLLSGILAATAYHVANGVVLVLIQVIAIRDLGGASAAGTIAAAEGLGGVAGAALALRYRPIHQLRAGFLTLALMPFWVLAYVWPATLTAVLIGAVVAYAGLSFFSVAWETTIQTEVPHHALARVASWDMLASFIGMPLGNAMAGPLAHALGTNHVLIGCATTLLAASATPLLVPGLRRLSRTNG